MINTNYHNRTRISNVNFGESQINICTFSDLHGREKELVPMYANIEKSADKIFINKDKNSTLNVMTIIGDYFFNTDSKGYLSDKQKTAGEFQLVFLNKFIESVKKVVPGIKTYFTVGNHDLDGGDKLLFKLLKKADMQTVLTNVDFDNSNEIAILTDSERDKILAKSKVLTVEDSKNPEKKNSVLLLGLSSLGLDYFFPKADGKAGITDNFKVFDRFAHTEKSTKENELEKTYSVVIDEIAKFKENNPNSPVIIMSHTGDVVAKLIAKNVPVDFILSGHDHIDLPDEDYMPVPDRRTKIISLAQDGKLFKSLQLHFSDEGQMDSVRVKTVLSTDAPAVENNPIKDTINETLQKDNIPTLKTIPAGKKLDKDNVRYGNSPLANTVTDMILEQIQEKDPDVLATGIASSAFRRGLADGSSNIDIINVLSGSIESQSVIKVGELTGHNLAEVILENVAKNRVKPDNLPLIQWSGIKIDKAGLIKIINSEINPDSKETLLDKEETRYKLIDNKFDEISKCIQIKNSSGEFEPIQLEKPYKIAMPNKFFVRSETVSVKKYGNKFDEPEFGDMTLNDLFRENLEKNNYTVKVSDDVRVAT